LIIGFHDLSGVGPKCHDLICIGGAARYNPAGFAGKFRKGGNLPPGVEDPALYHKHGDQMLLRESDSWIEHYAAKMQAAYLGLRFGAQTRAQDNNRPATSEDD
jgi:hypothetical protein